MDKALAVLFLADLEKRCGVSPLSREFIFEPRFASIRNQTRVLGTGGDSAFLPFLLREGMTNTERAGIFPGKFDLGNRRELDDRECTYRALLDEVFGKDTEKSPEDEFKTIRQGIEKLTGHTAADFGRVNKLILLKVVKLLHYLMRHYSASIFGLLAAPEDKKAGLEFRESYPYGKNEDSTWLVADLVAYLNAELTPKRIAEVDTTTSSMLLEVANSIERNVAQMILLNGKCVRAPIDVYASLTQHVESFQGIPESSSVVRLDETLYCYVRRLEFRHFAEIYPELVRVGTPRPQDIQVNAIAEEINVVGRAMFGRKLRLDQCVDLAMLDEGAIRISAEHFQAFARLNADSVGTLMSQALGHDVDERSYQKCMLHAQSLLAKVCLFDDHQSPGAVCVSLSRVVAAFCAIYFETDILAKRTNHKPYWHGQAAQGGSLLKALEAVSPENRLLDSVLLEEHSQIWRCRLDWFQAALKGQSSLHEARIAFRISLIRKVAKIARVTQARVVTRNLANLVDHVKGHCSKLVGLGDEGNWDVPVPSSGNSYTLDEVNSLISLSSTLAWAAGKGTV